MKEEKLKVCPICNKKFKTIGRRKYCSKPCSKIANAKRTLERTRRIRTDSNEISKVAAEARMHGMSYGYFVGMMWIEKIKQVQK